ncbi:hypothetical protein VNO77_40748 [Canavalia gladiata]|uniref:Uncharacterized protein n=1 Tax=Canavalia gladiata TaxID=3824 RepID=A0AAN9PRP5_CANGL
MRCFMIMERSIKNINLCLTFLCCLYLGLCITHNYNLLNMICDCGQQYWNHEKRNQTWNKDLMSEAYTEDNS